jgi:hypothetical protein
VVWTADELEAVGGVTTTPRPRQKKRLEGRAALLATMSEAQFRRQVITWAKRAGWLVYSIHDSRPTTWGTDKGYPDLTMTRGGRLIIAELKAEKGKPTVKQVDWLAALAVCPNVEPRLWRPSDEEDIKVSLA